MSPYDDWRRFANLDYEGFRQLAQDPSLSDYEKVGFPDAYRKGKLDVLDRDITGKLPGMLRHHSVLLDIGPGCSDLPRRHIERAEQLNQQLHLVDSAEMLTLLPESPAVRKVVGPYPDCHAEFAALHGQIDAILVYSVLQYVFAEGSMWRFVDRAMQLLAPGGALLLGDIPNASMRKRFLSSDHGKAFHRQLTATDEDPVVHFNLPEPDAIDDAVVLGLVMRARAAGMQAFVVPQHQDLPFANRREDILILRP